MSENQDFKDLFESSIVTKSEAIKTKNDEIRKQKNFEAKIILEDIKSGFIDMAKNGEVNSEIVIHYHKPRVSLKQAGYKTFAINHNFFDTPRHMSTCTYRFPQYAENVFLLEELQKEAKKENITIVPVMYDDKEQKELSLPCTVEYVVWTNNKFTFCLKCILNRSGKPDNQNYVPTEKFYSYYEARKNAEEANNQSKNSSYNTSTQSNADYSSVWKVIVIITLLIVGPLIAMGVENPLLGLSIIVITIGLIILIIKS